MAKNIFYYCDTCGSESRDEVCQCGHKTKKTILVDNSDKTKEVLEQQLAAANARIAGLEAELSQAKAWLKTMNETVDDRKQRAEQAEAQCVAMRTAINRYVIGNIELLDELKSALGEGK